MALTDGLVGLWHLNNDLKDSGPNGYDGQMIGAPVFVPGKLGSHGLNFDGVDDAVKLNFQTLNWTGLAVLAWVYIPTGLSGNNDSIMGCWDTIPGRNQRSFNFWGNATGVLSYAQSATGDDNTIIIADSAPLVPNTYYMTIAQWTGTTVEIWKNAVRVAGPAGCSALKSSANPLAIGAVIGNGAGDPIVDWNKATVDEVAIWNRPLTVDEITELWNNGNGIEIGAEVRSRRTRQMRATFFR